MRSRSRTTTACLVTACLACAASATRFAAEERPQPAAAQGAAALIELAGATIVTPETLSVPERTAVRVLAE